MKSLSFQTFIFTSFLGLAACGRQGEIHVLDREEDVAGLVEFDDKIDILFVVDNSLSMETKQELLAQGFKDFIEKFNEKKLDYQIGVISTETFMGRRNKLDPEPVTKEELSYFRQAVPMQFIPQGATQTKIEESPYAAFDAFAPGALVSFKGNSRILRADRNSSQAHLDTVAKQFKENIKLCTPADSISPAKCRSANPETGMRAFMAMLDPGRWLKTDAEDTREIRAWNQGFFRGDSRKLIVIVSDEDESHPARPDGKEQSQYFVEAFKDETGRAVETEAEAKVRVEKYLLDFKAAIDSLNEDPKRTYFVVVGVEDEKVFNNLPVPADTSLKRGAVSKLYVRAARMLPNADLESNILDISKKSYGEDLAKLGKSIVKSFNKFIIRQDYVEGSLKVIHILPDGSEVALSNDPKTGYTVAKHPTLKGQHILTIGSDVQMDAGAANFKIKITPDKPVQ